MSYLEQMEVNVEGPPPAPPRATPAGGKSPWREVAEHLEANPGQWGVFRDRVPSIASYLRNTWYLHVEVRDSTVTTGDDGKKKERCTVWVRAADAEERSRLKTEAQAKKAKKKARDAAKRAQERLAEQDQNVPGPELGEDPGVDDDDPGPTDEPVRDYMAESDADLEAQRRAAAAEASD